MKTFQKFLIVLGVFVFAYNASIIAHELGHALTIVATGGEFTYIEVSPFSWSYAHYSSDPEPMATSWGGFLWETVFGVLAFFVLWITKSRLSLFGVVLAIASLAGTGIYMVIGAVLRIGDSASLIRMGIPPSALIVIGSVLMVLVLPLVLPLGTLLGVGKGKNKLTTTMVVFSPIAVYLLAMLGFNLWQRPDEWPLWSSAVGAGLLVVVVVSLVVHWITPWCAGAETQRRAIPVNWRMCILSLALGGGVVSAEYIVFGKPAPVPVELAVDLWWFEDEQNYAGGLIDPSARGIDDGDAVFWKIDGVCGQKTLPSSPWSARWSSALDKLIIVTSTEVLTLSPSGEMDSLLAMELLLPLWRINDEGDKMILGRRRREPEGYFLVTLDVTTGKKSSREIESFPSGLTFIGANEAVVNFHDHRIAASCDDSGLWRFDRTAVGVPGERIVAVGDGDVVLEFYLPEKSMGNRYRLTWKGKSVELPGVQEVFSWRDKLLVTECIGPAYLVDSSMNAKMLPAAGVQRFRIGAGVSQRGLWIAYRDGEVVTHGDSEQRVMLKFPSEMP
ncbi:MAG: M50 family metallopeptidase [Phycisphaerae bacterium]|jgi:hypothetical protein|nr:M50 family metallopeptidase [Phycisphaerae bacterium]